MAPRSLLGKAELTGLIADAQGVYHDLSKGSFDAFSIKHPGASEHLSTALFNQPLVQGIHELATDAGIDLSAYDSLDMKGAAVAMAQHLGKKLGIGAGTEAVLGTAAAYAGVEVATGGFAIVGVAIESAIEWGIDQFTKQTDEPESYLRGDWVVIDEGMKTTLEVDRAIDVGMAQMFEDAPTLSELHTLVRVEDFHVGFYVSPGNAFGTVTVFDLLTGDTVEHFMVKVRKLPVARRVALDNDPFASKVRELYFVKTDNVKLDCEVSCEPGTEVLYKRKLYHIVKCDGDVGLIEAEDGSREIVPMAGLERSRQERAGYTVWRYKNGEAPENNSFVVTPDGFGTGDWVWVQRDADWELGMVHIISGDKAVVYMTQSGFRLLVPIGEIRVALRDVTDLYNRINDFVRCKVAAIEGRGSDVRRLRLPAKYRSIVRETNPKHRVDPKPKTVEVPQFHTAETSRPVETQERAERVDNAEELQNTLGIRNTVTQEVGAEDDACRRRLFGTGQGGDLCRENESSPYGGFQRTEEYTVVFEPSQFGLIAVGVAAVAGWYFFIR